MRIASGVFAAVFLLGAVVQLNDPDPFLWILAYAISAALSLAGAFGRPYGIASAVAAAVYGIWFLTLAATLFGAPGEAFTSFRMQAETHEEPREAVGLILLSGWNAALFLWSRKRGSTAG